MENEINKETLTKMRELRLFGMYETFKASLDKWDHDEEMTIDKFVNILVCDEYNDRRERNLQRLISSAGFKYRHTMETIDYSQDRNIDRNMMERLADLAFMRSGKNVFITGSTGTGKTHIACAIGMQACMKGYRVRYSNTGALLAGLKALKNAGNHSQFVREMNKIKNSDLIILEDFALGGTQFDAVTRSLLMQIIDERTGVPEKAVIIVSQIPVSKWYSAIGDNTVADAIMDRLVHGSIRLDLKGDSMRKKLWGAADDVPPQPGENDEGAQRRRGRPKVK